MNTHPPIAPIQPHVRSIHGEEFVDNYFWLRDIEKKDLNVIKYLENENNYTEMMMKPTTQLQQELFDEMKGRMKETDITVPYRWGEYYYYSRTIEGQQYDIRCRTKINDADASTNELEEILLDENKLAEGHDYFDLGTCLISPDHTKLIFSVDLDGSEEYTIRIKDLKSGNILTDRIERTHGRNIVWANDSINFLYTTLDEVRRPFKLFRHQLGTSQDEDELLYHETDRQFYLSVDKTNNNKYFILSLGSKMTDECWFLDANSPLGQFTVIAPRRQGVEYLVDHHEDLDIFLIVTNDNALNFKLMTAPVAAPQRENWSEFLPYDPEVKLEDITVFADFVVLEERRAGLCAIRICMLPTLETHIIGWPEPTYDVSIGNNFEYKTSLLRLSYSSMVTPYEIYDYNVFTRTMELRKRQIVNGFQPELYASERLYAKSADGGTLIPISLVYKKALRKNGPQSLILYGYGSYGISETPNFSSERISLLDRGIIFALAHIRGGGEMGRSWYEQGKLLNKQNTFDDFISCAEHLIQENYTLPNKLGIWGGSAGGLLMGAVLNKRPELFQVVVADVPFVDAINSMLDSTKPLTTLEYEEWGNPNELVYYEYMRQYSPYDNVTTTNYPHILITAGLNDPRVGYWEPAKWTARLRALNPQGKTLLLKTNMEAGHAGLSGRYDSLYEDAFAFAFLLQYLDENVS